VTYPGQEEANLISSITSTSVQKVTFVHESLVWGFESRHVNWGILDDPLCQLVDRSRCKRELEVDFRLAGTEDMGTDKWTGDLKIVGSFQKFRGRARMRVIWVDRDGSEHVIYSSAGVIGENRRHECFNLSPSACACH